MVGHSKVIEMQEDASDFYRSASKSDWFLYITYLTPLDHRCLLSLVSILTSGVPIIFSANCLTALIALGALFLNPLKKLKYKKNNIYYAIMQNVYQIFLISI